MKKKIVFLTGTRADFGKLKTLIDITSKSKEFETHIFVTGMHMNPKYGNTYDEIIKAGYENVFLCSNQTDFDSMDIVLSKTIQVFSQYINFIKPDLIMIHGDRVEPLAAAIVGAYNNILTGHIEGGEVSGTVDELTRHAISKMSHAHFVSNKEAKKRLIQMGENAGSIFVIGSPDIDIMLSKNLPDIKTVKKHYEIDFNEYAILIFHPVVTELEDLKSQVKNVVDAVIDSGLNYLVIYPNNDVGNDLILAEYERFKKNSNFKVYPSIRFENFLVLLKNAKFIVGNSSSGLKEAPYYKVPTVNIGTRQNGRLKHKEIITSNYDKGIILTSIKKALNKNIKKNFSHFGNGKSDKLFLKVLSSGKIWNISKQKIFKDLIFSKKRKR